MWARKRILESDQPRAGNSRGTTVAARRWSAMPPRQVSRRDGCKMVADRDPTRPPPPAHGLAPVLDRNIQALQERRRREERAASKQDQVADAITRFTGSMLFVYIHIAVFGFWIVANLHWIPGVPAWDETFV